MNPGTTMTWLRRSADGNKARPETITAILSGKGRYEMDQLINLADKLGYRVRLVKKQNPTLPTKNER